MGAQLGLRVRWKGFFARVTEVLPSWKKDIFTEKYQRSSVQFLCVSLQCMTARYMTKTDICNPPAIPKSKEQILSHLKKKLKTKQNKTPPKGFLITTAMRLQAVATQQNQAA